MAKPRPDEIVEWRFAFENYWAPHNLSAYGTRGEAIRARKRAMRHGIRCGPIARHVTRAPWLATKGKEKKPEGA